LNLTKSTKKEVTTPGKHVLLPGISCEKGCGQSLEITEGLLSWLQAMQGMAEEKGDAQYCGTLFNTHSTDMRDEEKWPAVHFTWTNY